VRGVAWRICWPRRKSSKKLPGLVFGADGALTNWLLRSVESGRSFSQNR